MAWSVPSNPVAGTSVDTATMISVLGDLTIIGGARTSYTPTLVNITVGSGGTTVGRYRQVDKEVEFFVQITLGTSPSITGGATISLPVTAKYTGWAADGSCNPAGTIYPAVGVVTSGSATTFIPRTWPTTAGNQWANITSTVPGTFASGNNLTFWGRYEAA